MNEQTVRKFAESEGPGANLVNAFPLCEFVNPTHHIRAIKCLLLVRYLPGWLPGTGFFRKAQESRELMHRTRDEPFQIVQDQNVKCTHFTYYIILTSAQAAGILPQCVASRLLDGLSKHLYSAEYDVKKEVIRDTLGSIYGGMRSVVVLGSDT